MTQQWKPIESAPKDGTEILVWRSDCGQFIASYTSADAFPMTQDELDAWDEETLFAKDWFTQWPDATRLEGSEVPTLWQPLPTDPCQACNDQGAVGNILTAEPCPDCTPPASAQDDAKDAARWRFIRRKLCLTGNGDGTCGMHAINLPASIPGWPDPGAAVAEFCDAAIDAAIAAQQGEGGAA